MSTLNAVVALLRSYTHSFVRDKRFCTAITGALLLLEDDDTEALQYVIECLAFKEKLLYWAHQFLYDCPTNLLYSWEDDDTRLSFHSPVGHPNEYAIVRFLRAYKLVERVKAKYPNADFGLLDNPVGEIHFVTFPDMWVLHALLILEQENPEDYGLVFECVDQEDVLPRDNDGSPAYSNIYFRFRLTDAGLPVDESAPELHLTYFFGSGSYGLFFVTWQGVGRERRRRLTDAETQGIELSGTTLAWLKEMDWKVQEGRFGSWRPGEVSDLDEDEYEAPYR